MIPEFPLPPSEADFYHKKLFELPRIFSIHTFKMPEVSMSDSFLSSLPVNTFDIRNAVKSAQIKHGQNRKSSAVSKSSRIFSNSSSLLNFGLLRNSFATQ